MPFLRPDSMYRNIASQLSKKVEYTLAQEEVALLNQTFNSFVDECVSFFPIPYYFFLMQAPMKFMVFSC